jgi:ribosomal protein L19E
MEQYSALQCRVLDIDVLLRENTDELQSWKTRLGSDGREREAIRAEMLRHLEATNEQAQEFITGLRDLRNELEAKLHSKVDIDTCLARDERNKKLAADILTASEENLLKRQTELSRVADALNRRDSRLDVLDSELRRTQHDLAEEISNSREVLRQGFHEALAEDRAALAHFMQRLDGVQSSLASQNKVLSEHSEWFRTISTSTVITTITL